VRRLAGRHENRAASCRPEGRQKTRYPTEWSDNLSGLGQAQAGTAAGARLD
jgi:hypothetical protein